jgi:hypothetical protein
MSNTGYATVACGANGQALKPLFIPRGYSNQDHAIFVVRPGETHLVHASRGKWGEEISVEIIAGIADDDTLITKTIGEYENGDSNIPSKFQSAVDAALEKCKCYHCREPHYYAD